MPGGDRTGPLGQGPMTGRRAGFCSGNNRPGYANPGFRRDRGFGRGYWRRGRGFWRRDYYPDPIFSRYQDTYQQPSAADEKAYLEDMVKSLEAELKDINERLKELSKEQ
jgi:hypothetical protein